VFLRSVKAAHGQHEYLRLVESFRVGDKVKQRIVAHLGRKDLLAPHLDALIRLLQDDAAPPRWLPADQISTPRASTWGPILAARRLFEKLSLGSILDAGRPPLRHGSRCRNASFFCWPIASRAPAVNMLWRSGWTISTCALCREAAGHRRGNSTAG